MIILGIADNHDAGAAVVVDGQLVSAVNQERIDRIKNSGAFPWGAIDSALEVAGIKEREVDRIVVGTAFTPSAFLRANPSIHHQRRSDGVFSSLLHAYVVYQSTLRATGLHTVEVDACRKILARRLEERPFEGATLQLMDHHRAHIHGAYRTQDDDHCLVLTVDAMGDGTTATASLGRHGQVDYLWRQGGMASVNSFYAKITELLGFRPNRHEGKITGLAALAEPPPGLVSHLQTRVRFEAPGFSSLSRRRPDSKDDPYWRALRDYSREEVAAAAQKVLEDAVVPFVVHWVERTGCRNVAVAGGTFANVKLNQRILESGAVDDLWVMPHMGDGGLAVGGALGSAGSAPVPLPHAYWGPGFTQRDCYKALKRGELPQINFEEKGPGEGVPGDVEEVARILASGREVAAFQGRMEWGPRALGNRSVLVSPRDPTVNHWLNVKLNRSEFMPFAPVVRAEDADRWFTGLEHAPFSSHFMTVCCEATAALREQAPAVVHVDGTCRPQLVARETHPKLHALLGRMGELTGTPVLINTSFNLHEEPIVCTPSDAVRAVQQSKLAALWMGPYVAENPAAEATGPESSAA